jgi:uncharacterized phage protein (TIGR02218 family)
MDVSGALSADAITAEDLRQGRYDGAEVRLFMVDWRNPSAGQHLLARGQLGTIEAGTGGDSGFSATMRGPTAAFAAGRIEAYSPECRADFGDWRCRVPLRGRSLRAAVSAVTGDRLWLAGLEAAAAYATGRVRVLSGPLAGLERRVIAVEAGALRLDEAISVAVGARVEVQEGCDKQFATCAGRFGNGLNFRGEPHVPGNDVLTRFGGF